MFLAIPTEINKVIRNAHRGFISKHHAVMTMMFVPPLQNSILINKFVTASTFKNNLRQTYATYFLGL
jgi:hypothetical protein